MTGVVPGRLLRCGVALLVCGCGARSAAGRGTPGPNAGPTVVLVSLDGFRYDYLDRYASPNLHRIISAGVRAPLVAAFPTKTFPNHYTIVTGLFPEHHGVVENTIYDPVFDALFRMSDSLAVRDARWWGGEPLWVTAERQGRIAASFFWPGSETAIEGVRPHYWERYDVRVPNATRVRQVLDWLGLPPERRPAFVTLYFSDVDHAGHENGPDSPEVAAAVLQVDSAVGMLLDGIARAGLGSMVDVIIISDHGMSPTTPDSVVALDDYLPLDLLAHSVGGNPIFGLWPKVGMEDSVYRALHGRHPHLAVWRKSEIPARFHYRDNRRIAPIFTLVDPGWSLALRRSDVLQHPDQYRGGAHGYDDTASVMRAIFLASGPAFRSGYVAAPFRNIHIYDLIAGILRLTPAPNDGSPDSTASLLRR